MISKINRNEPPLDSGDSGQHSSNIPSPVVLILGLPGSGKTTVGERLASALGWEFISIGNLIRASLVESNLCLDDIDIWRALRGERKFNGAWIGELLSRALSRRSAAGPLIIDAGPAFDDAIANIQLDFLCTLFIAAPDNMRRRRFLSRNRVDTDSASISLEALFDMRSTLYRNELNSLIRCSSPAPFISIENTGDIKLALYQSLSAVTISYSIAKLRHIPNPTILADKSQALSDLYKECTNICATVSQPSGATVALSSPHFDLSGGRLTMLIKWGSVFSPVLLDYVRKRLFDAGYFVSRMRVLNGAAIRASGLVRAHLGLHYILARWGNLLCPFIPNGASDDRVYHSAFSLAERYGNRQLRTWWYGNAGRIRREGRGFWCVNSDDLPGIIINGHIPSIVDESECLDSHTVALEIAEHRRFPATPLAALRETFLGASDPEKAVSGSLRSMAFHKKLGIESTINIEKNVFHLSGGYLEAKREAMIWFDSNPSGCRSPINREHNGTCMCMAIDRPIGNGSNWTFSLTEGKEFTEVSNELRHITCPF